MRLLFGFLKPDTGGKLGLACEPTRTVSLVLSDVIGDPLEFIASGPTVPNTDADTKAWEVVNKYHIENQLPANVTTILTSAATAEVGLVKPTQISFNPIYLLPTFQSVIDETGSIPSRNECAVGQ